MNPAPAQALVIFGASGDLTRRKILPALYELSRDGLLPDAFSVVGYSRTELTDEEFREQAREAVAEFARSPVDEDGWKPFADTLSYVAGGFDEAGAMAHLHDHLHRTDGERGTDGRRLFYCATPPSAFPLIVRRLSETQDIGDARIVIEKPYGRDLASARALSEEVHRVFDESRVFRIDHYLGKETVQNILVFRFANSMYERVWNRDAIDHVQITVAEEAGVSGRGPYYEEAGAIRDMIQNHVLQVLAFLAMEPPRALDAEAIRDEKEKVLRALRPPGPDDVVRGQYGPGDGIPGYRDEDGVARDSTVETYAAMRAHIENWRWAGVPFFLRTGKSLPRRATEITVVFRESPGYLFESVGIPAPPADHLSIRIQPEEGMSFAFEAKMPGPGFVPETVRMDFSYAEHFGSVPGDAYERLLYDAMTGDGTLFTRKDAVERAWEIAEPILADPGPLHFYPAGSWGPDAAEDLIAPRRWHLK